QAVINFFLSLNLNRQRALDLPKASEGCFSIQEYLNIIEKRIQNLIQVEEKHVHFKDFLAKELIPFWKKLKENTIKKANELNFLVDSKLSIDELCITPSDFGFHNILIKNNRPFFIDFEYAGWDDPAKTISDFFCQPKIPIPMKYFEYFMNSVINNFGTPEKLINRIYLVFPLCKIKWCCILLNSFINTGKNRRFFANAEELKEEQIIKSKTLLDEIIHHYSSFRFF
ncbi:MAG: hypothetical protein WCT85_05390, partial [Parachlamydiales bacterium]